MFESLTKNHEGSFHKGNPVPFFLPIIFHLLFLVPPLTKTRKGFLQVKTKNGVFFFFSQKWKEPNENKVGTRKGFSQ